MRKAGYESEEDTKVRYITPAIQHAGWQSSQIMMEYSLKADRYRIIPEQNCTIREKQASRTKPDYILFRDVNRPLAVVEAKKRGKTARDGLDQAIEYARLLDVPFAYASAGEGFIEFEIPTGTLRELPLHGFPSPEDLWKRWCALYHVSDDDRKTLESAQYYTSAGGMTPRYYQMQAINRTVDAVVAKHRRRALLVMATGTGKTYTAFQIVWRLKKAGVVKNVLYLADRNQLVDQTMIDDFSPFRAMYKIQKGTIDRNYEIYFGLYQQLKGDESEPLSDHFRQVPENYFDLIIVDECHRGSADEQSSWRDVLEYFKSAIQIGMTATPNEKDGANNIDYFGEPLFTYTLKQGIEDGFLAPYQVISVHLDKDVNGWEPGEDDVDVDGRPVPRRLYRLSDFDKTLEIRDRTRKVAEVVTNYLHHLGRMSKTIIFCVTQRHAAAMRDAIRECNRDMVARDYRYAVRMTADDEEGRGLYQDFTSVNSAYPVVVTTSKLLTTGANTRCVKLIVLDSNIRSMTEFKQIIGRGTRLRPDAGKTFFTILDFRNACALFHDPDFDGPADNASVWSGEGDPPCRERPVGTDGGRESAPPEAAPEGVSSPEDGEPSRLIVVDGVEVSILGRSVSYLDENGRLVTEKFEEYTKRNILSCYGTEEAFRAAWNGPTSKRVILEELEKRGVMLKELRKELGNPDLDEFDMIRHIAFGAPMLTRKLRAARVKSARFLERYQGTARAVLEKLLDAYEENGVSEIDGVDALRACANLGGVKHLLPEFNGKEGYMEALRAMQHELYEEEEEPA
ncbi:EcoAI/FtnUII family type I restriction enzme subunit R [uncultured Mailhella sp.]|uniref:EcoAI/FtnUII family type I restriction enzme subunit R n=1 Tax=uncultured Mailhella sp. TaxID=1981031 RepID=UPI0025D89896|nr:DEAD/DEAH box helicase family protein [uncultured Mailhella sp.]